MVSDHQNVVVLPWEACWKGRSKGRATWRPQTRAGEAERRGMVVRRGRNRNTKTGGIFPLQVLYSPTARVQFSERIWTVQHVIKPPSGPLNRNRLASPGAPTPSSRGPPAHLEGYLPPTHFPGQPLCSSPSFPLLPRPSAQPVPAPASKLQAPSSGVHFVRSTESRPAAPRPPRALLER